MDFLDSILKNAHKKVVVKRVIAILSVVVMLFTVNSTRKFADTLERIPACGIEEHIHTEACFDADGNVACGLAEHVHTDACYQERPKSAVSAGEVQSPVEEIQDIELDDIEQSADDDAGDVFVDSDANFVGGDIDAPAEESEEQDLEDADEAADITGEEDADAPSDEAADTEAQPETEVEQGYIVGAQNPFYLSDIISDQGLDISIEDVVEVGQAVESDDAPVLFSSEPVDGDVALYVNEDFERAELAISTEAELYVVELLYGIAPMEESMDGQDDMETSAETEEAIDAVEAIPSEAVESDEEQIEEVTEEIPEEEQTEEAAEETSEEEQTEETVEETSEEEQTEETTEETSEEEQTEEAVEETSEEEQTEEAAEETSEEEQTEETVEETSDEEQTEEAAEETSEEEQTEEAAEETSEEEQTEEAAEETSEEEQTEEAGEDTSDEEESDVNDKEQSDEEQTDITAEDSAQPQRVEAPHYEATIDLAEVDAYPIALTDLMDQAIYVDAETASPVDVEEAAAAEPDGEALPADENAEETEEIVEAAAVEPTRDEVTFELDGEDLTDPEVSGTLDTDAWTLDYDAAVLSIERDGNGYALSVIDAFKQTVVTVNNGELYTITLLNGSAPVLYPAAAFTASTDYVNVNVEAAEGAFPAGTTMVVADVEDEDTISGITDKVEEGFVRVERVHAVDITFLDANGEEIEPRIPISVTMSVREIEQEKETVVIHVDHEGEAQVVDGAETAVSEANNQDGSVEAADEDSAGAGTAVAFSADSFSVYAIVVGEKLETKAIAADGSTYRIEVTYAEDAQIPVGATLAVEEVTGDAAYLSQVAEALPDGRKVSTARFFDIRIMDGTQEVQPSAPVMVRAELVSDGERALDAVPCAVHFTDDAVDVINAIETEAAVSFRAESFSVWGVVYTVDFHYEVDGKVYEFSLPGGGFVSLTDLVEALGLTGAAEPETETDDIFTPMEAEDVASSDAAKAFVADVADVAFSSPELVDVSKAEMDTTVGQIKELRGLEIQYSAELTEEQIEAINNSAVEAGDWALIGVQPFTTEESLTVTMKDGEVFTVKVTDAQIQTYYLSNSGELYEVTVTYGDDAQIPNGATLEITEFGEGSSEYEYARNSVLADKLSKGEWVDLDNFGLAALDISILNPDGEEIEPEAPVQVDIRIKELPGVEDLSEVADTLAIQHHVEVEDGVVVETVFDGNTDASFRLETNETVAAEGVAVDPYSVNEEDFNTPATVEIDGLNISFEATAFSTFTVTWRGGNRSTTVHYVDENGRELTISNTNNTYQNLNANSTSPAYLIYDVEGYEYAYTYVNRNNNANRINPMLVKDSNNRWMYKVSETGYVDYYGNVIYQGTEMSDGDNIYVVYKKKAAIAQGGTPTVKQSGDVAPPVEPRINKESTPNGDDTNTLALSIISDTAKLEVEKLADVIVVFDVSGSMSTNDMGNNTTRLQAAKKAVNDLADQLSKKKNSAGEPLVRMSLIQFSTKASTVLGMTDLTSNGVSQIQTAVNRLSTDGGTNWDHALQLANEENDLDSGRATFVIFVTDGDPTFRHARMDVTNLQLQGETNDTALNVYRQVSPNPWYLEDNVYGPGDNDKTGKCYDAAVVQGNAIVSAKKNIYTIGISNDVTKVQTFNSDIHGSGAYLASNSSALQQAFSDIEAKISGALGWGNIQMTDGITNLSNTVQKTGLINVGGDFTYWKAPAPENWASMTEEEKKAYKPSASDFVSWDPVAAGAAPAQYNTTTGAVEWNMGNTFMPEAGVTYQVRFKVWPSQEAYDYIAKLNNGTLAYDSLPADVKAQIIKSGNSYTLKTNEPDAKTTYQSATKSGDTVTVSGETQTLMFPTVEDLNLSVDKMKVNKEWINDLDPDARWKSEVTLLLTDGAGNLYKSISLNENNHFTAEDNFISCGLAKIENNELVIYEKGHDFQLTEPDDYAYYWDLDSQIYRPMIIDARLTMLVKTDAPSDMGDKTVYEYQGAKYYKIEEGTYKVVSTDDDAATITATNIRRSNLNLTKKVVDEENKPVISSEAFTFTITINDAHGDDVWFTVQKDANDTKTVVKDITTDATAEEKNGERTGSYYAKSGSPITVSIEPGWNLRFTNLPNGTTYTIKEEPKENYTFVSAAIDNNGTFLVENGTTGSGTINESNTQYTVTYTNSALTQQVIIQKTTQDGTTPLPGAVFSLYTESGYHADPKSASQTDLTSETDGKIDLGRLACGTYYLEETSAPAGYILLSEPVEITVSETGVTYNQNNSMSRSGNGISHDETTDIYTLTVTNNAGAKLPATGGPGTARYTITGMLLILAAATLLLRKRREN